MKKIFSLIFILAVLQTTAFAQFNQGTIYIDGSLNYNVDNNVFDNSNYSTKANSMNFSPSVGYFLMNNFVVGVGLDYQSYNNNSSTTTNYMATYPDGSIISAKILTTTAIKWNVMAPAVFAKYIMPISDKLSFSFKAKYTTGSLKDNTTITQDSVFTSPARENSINIAPTNKPKSSSSKLNLSVAFQYLVTNKIGLELNFAGFTYASVPKIQTYDQVTYNNVITWGTENTSSFNINPASWSVGVFVLLGGQK